MVRVKVIQPNTFVQLLSKSTPKKRVVPIDATWYMPNVPKNGQEQFFNEDRLPGAAFFNLDEVCSKSPYPHMLANYDTCYDALNNLGLNKSDHLVVYDRLGVFSAPRAAWNLLIAGHQEVYLLDHFPDYKNQGLELDTTKISSTATDAVEASLIYNMISEEKYEANTKAHSIDYDELLQLVSLNELGLKYVVFDARSEPRFTGEAPEPRPGLSSGHVPTALSLPFPKVLTENGNFKSKNDLIELFKHDFGLDLSQPLPDGKKIIVMCGTGVTAVILQMAIDSVIESPNPVRVYDGSWTEWAQRAPSEYIVKD